MEVQRYQMLIVTAASPNAGTNGTLTVCAETTQAMLNYLLR
jgi:hypothetical protein